MLTKEIISGFNLLSLAGFVVMGLTLALNRTGRAGKALSIGLMFRGDGIGVHRAVCGQRVKVRGFPASSAKFAARPCGELCRLRVAGLIQMQAFPGNLGGVSSGFPLRPQSRANPSPRVAMCLTNKGWPGGHRLGILAACT